jgi:hypothetical protein
MAKGAGNPVDAMIQLLLYVCFGVYVVIGLGLITMGAIYWNDIGAVSATATLMLTIGLFMLIVGGLALFANAKQIWLILIVIELINIALFTILTATIVIAAIFALGWSDPVADLVKRNWNDLSEQEAKGYKATPKSACYHYVQECKTYAATFETIANKQASGCYYTPNSGADFKSDTRDQHFYNASKTGVTGDLGRTTCTWYSNTHNWAASACVSILNECSSCMSACQTRIINEGKEGTEAATLFVLCTCLFCIVAVVWNNFLTLGGNDEFEGNTQLIGFVINGIVLLVGFVMTIACGARLIQTESYTLVLFCLMMLGVFLLVSGGMVIFGIWKDQPMFINLGNLLLGIFGYLCFILGIGLAVCTGTVMGEAQTQYDQNYAKVREAAEKYDPSICKLTDADCLAITTTQSNDVLVMAGGTTKHSSNDVWEAQYEAMQKNRLWLLSIKNTAGTAAKYQACISSQTCVACHDLLKSNSTIKNGGTVSSLGHTYYYTGVDLASYASSLSTSWNWTKWQEMATKLANRTKESGHAGDKSAAQMVGRCEKALQSESANTQTCATTANCTKCTLATFTVAGGNEDWDKDNHRCLTWAIETATRSSTVGNLQKCSPATDSATCRAHFTTSATKVANHDEFKKKMSDEWCLFSDAACKAKLTQKVEDEMTTLAVVGLIFIGSYLVIMYLTMRGIVVYKSGDDDDDDDE